MNQTLEALLAPYRAAVQGDEINFAKDPLYSLLNPPTKQQEKGDVGVGAAAGLDQDGIAAMVKRMARNRYGWAGNEWDALYDLVSRESGWNPEADNPTSTAYGLFQFLDSTRKNYGIGLNANPRKQAAAGLRYVLDRYGSPTDALAFHDAKGWY